MYTFSLSQDGELEEEDLDNKNVFFVYWKKMNLQGL